MALKNILFNFYTNNILKKKKLNNQLNSKTRRVMVMNVFLEYTIKKNDIFPFNDKL